MNEILYRNISEESKKNMSSLKHTGIELTSGIVAGIAAATLSQVPNPPIPSYVIVACRYVTVANQQGKGW